METIFLEIAAIIVVSTGLALIAKLLKQPIILAFMLAGIILGPLGLNWLHSKELLDVLSTFGIAFLLFLIGIELDIKKFKALNKVALLSGFGQVFFTGLIGFGIAYLLNFSIIESLFIAVVLTFSSTIIIVKLLSEKRQLNSLYGRITIAILIIQDFLAVFALLLVESFGGAEMIGIPWGSVIEILFKAVFIGMLAFVLAKYVFRQIFKFIGSSQELLFLWSIAWCLMFAGLSLAMDFSIAIGVFFAGIALATLEYNYEIAARIRSLRDFFIVIFFAFLGSQLVLTLEPRLILTSLLLSLFVLIGNPLIVYLILILSKHKKRTALFAGLTVSQISEFSFIIVIAGLAQGYIDEDFVAMIAIIGLITMVISTYFITYNEKIYKFLQPLLDIIPSFQTSKDEFDYLPKIPQKHVVIFGYHLTVNKLIAQAQKLGQNVVVVDYNPSNSDIIKQQGVFYIYGDMRDEEILQRANLMEAVTVVSTVPHPEATMSLLQYAKHFKLKANIIVSARFISEVEDYYNAGATFVLHTESIGIDYLKRILKKGDLSKAGKQHHKEISTLLEDSGLAL
ncbi:MAG: cation:proton antiporter [bacterium]|nr:cation:proton antiporter [bacterium]